VGPGKMESFPKLTDLKIIEKRLDDFYTDAKKKRNQGQHS